MDHARWRRAEPSTLPPWEKFAEGSGGGVPQTRREVRRDERGPRPVARKSRGRPLSAEPGEDWCDAPSEGANGGRGASAWRAHAREAGTPVVVARDHRGQTVRGGDHARGSVRRGRSHGTGGGASQPVAGPHTSPKPWRQPRTGWDDGRGAGALSQGARAAVDASPVGRERPTSTSE